MRFRRGGGRVYRPRRCGWNRIVCRRALARFDCRNNRLADLALRTDGFADAVAAARRRYGADRIAVVLGTSTSGVLSGEEAYRARDPHTGALPAAFDYGNTQDMFSLAGFVRAALGAARPGDGRLDGMRLERTDIHRCVAS